METSLTRFAIQINSKQKNEIYIVESINLNEEVNCDVPDCGNCVDPGNEDESIIWPAVYDVGNNIIGYHAYGCHSRVRLMLYDEESQTSSMQQSQYTDFESIMHTIKNSTQVLTAEKIEEMKRGK